MYTLYYMPGSCSMAIHVLLNELGQDVKLVSANTEGTHTRSPEFLKINPRGTVPTLIDGDTVVREGAAIILYLTAKHNSPLLPAAGKARTDALQWLMFCNATLHPAYGRVFFAKKNFTGAEQEKYIVPAAAIINNLWKDVEERLAQSAYLAGTEMTVADILLTVIANWSHNVPVPLQIGAKTRELFKRVIARPGYQKALTTEKVEYKEAA